MQQERTACAPSASPPVKGAMDGRPGGHAASVHNHGKRRCDKLLPGCRVMGHVLMLTSVPGTACASCVCATWTTGPC